MATLPTNSGRIVLTEHAGFGIDKIDYPTLANFHQGDKPHDFTQMVSHIFAASNRFTNKTMHSLTMAKGNYHSIDTNLYEWSLIGDDTHLFRVTKLIETSGARHGFNQAEFRIVLDKGWMHEPDLISAMDNNYTLKIKGHPEQIADDQWVYRVIMQSSDPTAFIPTSQIQVGATFMKVATSVANTGNRIGGTGHVGSQVKLRSQLGHYAEQASVDDKVVRKEIQARRKRGVVKGPKKNADGSFTGYGALSGYHIPFGIWKNGQLIEAGAFMSFLEADVHERIEMGREWMCWFGKTSQRLDYSGRHIETTGPGIRELQLDGHIFYHNGAMTVQQLQDYLMQIFFARVSEPNREIYLVTGTLGSLFLDAMLSEEAGAFLTVDTTHIRPMAGGESWELEYGAQFKSFRGKNGVLVKLVLDPMKDNPKYCRRFHPDNPQYPIDSGRMDILDFGANSDSPAPNGSNISMVMENDVESYMWIANAIDPYNGVVNDGSIVSNNEKEVTLFRESSGSPVVWDTSRLGAIIYEPDVQL